MLLSEQINDLIKQATLRKELIRLETLRQIKAAFLNFKTAKNAGELNRDAEISIIMKLIKQHQESIEMYQSGNRSDLVNKEQAELDILEEFAPKPVTKEDIENYLRDLSGKRNNEPFTKKDMGTLIKTIKESFPGVDGKLTADIVKEYIHD